MVKAAESDTKQHRQWLYHEDHYGGIDDLANDSEITIGEVYDRGDKPFIDKDTLESDTYASIISRIFFLYLDIDSLNNALNFFQIF